MTYFDEYEMYGVVYFKCDCLDSKLKDLRLDPRFDFIVVKYLTN